MRILGIDPGLTGALVMLEDGQPIEWTEMPTYAVGSGNRVNCAALASWIKNLPWLDEACVELTGARPGQGVTSMYTFGHACGSVSGVLGALEIPVTMVTPQSWKKRAGLTLKDKDEARSKAIQIWPHWRDLDKKGKGQALADAALIAKHGRA
jgi:crossover junction endodeoxyribonuclease RuvC